MNKAEKHLMLLFLSPYRLNRKQEALDEVQCSYDGKTITYHNSCEPGVAYVSDKLSPQLLDRLLVITSQEMNKELTIELPRHETFTHTEKFIEEISKYLAKDKILTVAYDESCEPTAESFRCTLELAEQLRSYIRELRKLEPDAAIFLHIDITGGFRHAVMLTLIIAQLLKYLNWDLASPDIRLQNVVYTSFVNGKATIADVSSVHGMFDMIAGAEEFKRFGSVDTIKQYFRAHPSDNKQLNSLINLMYDFSEALAICRTGEIKALLPQLSLAIEEFRPQTKDSIADRMFAQLLDTIHTEYADIISPMADDTDIIGWCLQREFLQQAMTLYIELVPKYLVQKKIIEVRESDCVEALKNNNQGYQSWEYVLLTKPETLGSEPQVAATDLGIAREWLNRLVDAEQKGIRLQRPTGFAEVLVYDGVSELKKAAPNLLTYLKTYSDNDNVVYRLCQYRYFLQYQQPAQDFATLCNFVRKSQNQQECKKFAPPYKYLMSVFIELKSRQPSNDHLAYIFKFPNADKLENKTKGKNSPKDFDTQWQFKQEMLLKIQEEKQIYFNYPQDFTLQIIQDYNYLRDLRNQINHANDTKISKNMSNQEIKKLLEWSLENITGLLKQQ